MNYNWRRVPIDDLVDAVLKMATTHGEAELFVSGSQFRIVPPGTFTAEEYDDHGGTIRRGTPRKDVTRALLTAFVLAADE